MRGLGSQSSMSLGSASKFVVHAGCAHQRTLPKLSNTDSEHHQAPIVRRHRVVCKEAPDHLSQPFPLFRNRLVPPALQFSFTLCIVVCMRSRRVLRWSWNPPIRFCPQIIVKPKKVKVSGLPCPRSLRLSAA